MTRAGGERELYVRHFRERLLAMGGPAREVVEGPGLVALPGTAAEADGRILVTDDRAHDQLRALLPTVHALVVNVFSAAEACRRLVRERGGYRPDACTAMVCADLAVIPEPLLPPGLTPWPVVDGSPVPLEAAAAAALASDPTASPAQELEPFLRYLRSIPHARFFAATDARGVVRATAASATYGTSTGVFFVNTDPSWRRRGVGSAMTALALRAAAEEGARTSVLDASSSGYRIYRRLGFTPVGELTHFVRAA